MGKVTLGRLGVNILKKKMLMSYMSMHRVVFLVSF